jgi:hypothetical protein
MGLPQLIRSKLRAGGWDLWPGGDREHRQAQASDLIPPRVPFWFLPLSLFGRGTFTSRYAGPLRALNRSGLS